MLFGQAVSSFFRNYVNFSGRASRSEFWYSMLFVVAASVVARFIDPFGVAGAIVNLGTFLPSAAVAARRLHDINRSGWHQLLSMVFPIGSIAMLAWYCREAPDGEALETSDTPVIPPPITQP